MRYVALLSGGKDSCYNLLHCHRNGHELVAAATLGPGHGRDEIDSYMYQTVGQDAIEFVAEALEVPLYRRVISGSAVDLSSEYGARHASGTGVSGDETEDLYTLLSDVKSHHPEIQGVSVGAILSNYQRVRVEHVCRRLSLTPLCYLWQREQAELLSEMADAGLEAVLIKVAGIGLTVKHLGTTLAEMHPTLTKLNDLYGSHICGEGGEYETLTIDCPLFKRRIQLTETETVIHSDNDFATVAYLRVKGAVLVDKTEQRTPEPAVPAILGDEFAEVRDAVAASRSDPPGPIQDYTLDNGHATHPFDIGISDRKVGPWVVVSNVQRDVTETAQDISVEAEVRECFEKLDDRLRAHSLDLSHCANINVFLSSMELFPRMNAVYAAYFGTSPPSRACVALDLPSPIRVRLDCIAYAEQSPSERQALHVQGLSYWAPANIGPYSQAIIIGERIFMSGQIGLIPSSLTLPSPRSLALETALACQHVDRITHALRNNSGGGWEGYTQVALYWLSDGNNLPHVRAACSSIDSGAPTLFLVVPALPKNALVEKQVLQHTGRVLASDGQDMEIQSLTPTEERGEVVGTDGKLYWEISRFPDAVSPCMIICVRGQLDHKVYAKLESLLDEVLQRAVSVRIFHTSSASLTEFPALLLERKQPMTSIPCCRISSRRDDDWDYAICTVCN